MTTLTFTDGTAIRCEYTPDGPDKSLRFACGEPAVVSDDESGAFYCSTHWPVVASRRADEAQCDVWPDDRICGLPAVWRIVDAEGRTGRTCETHRNRFILEWLDTADGPFTVSRIEA